MYVLGGDGVDCCSLTQVLRFNFFLLRSIHVQDVFSLFVQMHRRTIYDDDLGIIEALNELGIDGDGVVYTGRSACSVSVMT